MKANNAVLSFSGGLDSTCLLLKLLSEGKRVKAFSFNYGQKHKIELKKAKENVRFLQDIGLPLEWMTIDLTDAFKGSISSLHSGSGVEIPEGHYEDENMKSTVVENRNIIFSSIVYGKALAWAKLIGEPVDIYLGLHSGDHSIYPDCREESRLAAELCFKISNWDAHLVGYKAPFVEISKGEVLAEGLKSIGILNLERKSDRTITETEEIQIWRNTHTCYNPDPSGRSCGKCGSCTERLEAFAFCNKIDPAPYIC